MPSFIGMSSIIYGAFAALLGVVFVLYAARLFFARTDETADAIAISLFKYSILYLFLIFLALIIDRAAREFNVGGAL